MASFIRPVCACLLSASLGALPAYGQALASLKAVPQPRTAAPAATPSESPAAWLRPSAVDLTAPPPASPFRTLRRDFGSMFGSKSNWRIFGVTAALALSTSRFDDQSAVEAREHLPRSRFAIGNTGGSLLVQGGGAVATWALGKAFGSPRLTALGGDLVQAQIVTQTIVQGLKFSVRRPRPDGSNRLSFPSGHTASTFATASVLQRHFGWKAGIPAYAFASYVGAARMSADKHHLSDVIMGAGIGIVAGRTVTIGVGRRHFDLGVAPTVGGAMVTFNRR